MCRVRNMASKLEHSNFRSNSSLVFTLFLVLCWLKPQGQFALHENLNHQKQKQHLHHTVSLSSLLPSHDQSSCNNIIPSTTNGPGKRKASVGVAHRYGACSINPQGRSNKAETSGNLVYEILSNDQARVKSIKARLENSKWNEDLSLSSRKGDRKSGVDKKTTKLPAQRGTALGSGNYIVDIGIGTPAKQVSMIFDTGSDLTWTQCEPCVSSCYKQKQPIFDPSKSTSYSNISCSAPLCSNLKSATSITPGCSSSTCVYGIQYGDQSFSVGFFAKETVTLSGTELLQNIPFGCGQNNRGLFGSTAGLIGLGRHPLSIVSQTAGKYHKVFSYCLPTARANSRGYLSFGSSGLPANLRYTTFSTSGDLFYKISITAITVGGYRVPLSATALQSDGESIIDSGTVITRLPASIYNPMRDTFKKQMATYKLAQPYSILDTCYDFSNQTSINIPKISFYFSGTNVKIDIVANGILLAVNGISQVCLAFAAGDNNIFGNMQQQTVEVVYDVAGGKIGFAPNACA